MKKAVAPIAGLTLVAACLMPLAAEAQVGVRVGPGGVGVRIGEGHHRGRHYGWGPGFYFYDGYYHGNCGWLKRRAEETRSHVWWKRYRQCREG
ncbi:MAG: hypothetical protein JSS20_14755 [Proteobacteria bacterium]|nr:hypothetical protein [Pseudomonadota bacterium]